MPQFAPSEAKRAIAPITVKPTNLSCQTELYLVSNGTKAATSGMKSFTSTGAKQDISFPITMPGVEGAYPVYLDIFTNGLLIGAYKATEDVVIVAPPPEFAYVSAIGRHWLSTNYDYFTVDVQNVGDIAGVCTLEFWTNHTKRGSPYVWTGWKLVATLSDTLQPGQVKTFGDESCRCYVTGRDSWVMWYVEFRGEPGVIAKQGKHWE